MSLYNQMRPTTFDEVFGQEEAVAMLKAIVAQKHEDRPKVFLLVGNYGSGKTTLATVFAKAIGVDSVSSDFIVVDAGKDRGIDNIRNTTDKMGVYPWSKQADGRVFVFDECHALRKDTAEALLKKCEDVPPKTYIFFCSTETNPLPKALISRCKVIKINPITPQALYKNLIYVCNKASIEYTEEALKKIATNSDNSARVSLQILENYKLNGGNVEKAIAMATGAGEDLKVEAIELCRAIVSRSANWASAMAFFAKHTGQSEPIRQCILGYLKSCIIRSTSENDRRRFAQLIECFAEPLFYSGDTGLIMQVSNAFDVK